MGFVITCRVHLLGEGSFDSFEQGLFSNFSRLVKRVEVVKGIFAVDKGNMWARAGREIESLDSSTGQPSKFQLKGSGRLLPPGKLNPSRKLHPVIGYSCFAVVATCTITNSNWLGTFSSNSSLPSDSALPHRTAKCIFMHPQCFSKSIRELKLWMSLKLFL
jgi:hypothetical protein